MKCPQVAGFQQLGDICGRLWADCPVAGKGKSPVFHRKTRGAKTGASSSAAMASAVTAEFRPSIDRKKGRFLGLFCRKTGVRRQLFNTLLCVFTCFWDSRLFQTLAPQGEPARERLQNKSCLKTYRRFFVRSGMCLTDPMKVEMTGRDEGCGRRAALRAAARLCRNYAVARGAHAPSPSQAGGARNSGATRRKRVQSYRNRTATPGEELHQIAPNCTKLPVVIGRLCALVRFATGSGCGWLRTQGIRP